MMILKPSFFGSAPFVRIALAYIGGILLGKVFASVSLIFVLVLFLLLLSALAFLPSLTSINHNNKGAILFALIVVCGIAYKKSHYNNQFCNSLPNVGYFTGRVLEKTSTGKKWDKYEVRLSASKSDDNKVCRLNELVLVHISDTALNKQIKPGNYITFKAKFNELNNNNNPGEFSYGKYMLGKGIRYQSYIWGNVLVGNGLKTDLRTAALNVRSFLLKLFENHGITGDEFAVLSALVLGEKDYLTSQIKKGFANSGAMHVLSVSGLHVGILYLLLSFLLAPLGNAKSTRILKFVLLFSFLWLYAFITGLSASVLRSATMFSFVLLGDSFGRRCSIYNSIAASAVFLTLIDPNIVEQIGFQLSYSALLGIVFFQPKLMMFFNPKSKLVTWCCDVLTVSVAAQIGTFPIALYYFHQFPNFFILSNFVVIPLAVLLLYGTVLFFITSFVPIVPSIIAFLLKWATWVLNYSVAFIDKLPNSTTTDIWISPLMLCLLMFSILIVALFIHFRSAKLFLLMLSVLFGIVVLSTFEHVRALKQKVLVFYGGNAQVLSFISGTDHYYYSASDSLSVFDESLLDKCSGHFGTSSIKRIEFGIEANNLIKTYQNNLFVKNLLIKIASNYRNEKNNDEVSDIVWDVKEAKVYLNKKSDFLFDVVEYQVKPNIIKNKTTGEICLKTNGAVVLKL